MSSISKLTPSAINTALEVAPALANLNFDFSLYKIEAPKEFNGVGSALSTFRRDEAENGMPHATARKLGALFDSVLPATPNVTRAYGQRASEISQISSISPQTRSKYGVFSNRAGSDATSVWAAATSGPAAIAIHLLACLLAKMWDGPEATAIWAEIVHRRKESVREEMNANNIVEMATLAAAQQDISRAQLAEWDASARSWLRTADAVKIRQQKQLMLIIDNIKGSVNKMNDTYESVLKAWKNSLTQMEGLIQGISQQAMSGEILLALSAWHLFPDMLVVVPCKTLVHQHDDIFASGGVLTIGLEKSDYDHNGIHWSLPLASLRHYGAPVVSSCSINSIERSRISLIELQQAFLGCFLQGWGDAASDTLRAVRWLSQISRILDDAACAGWLEAKAMIKDSAEFSWLNILLSASRYHLGCQGNEKLIAKKLVSLGRRHGKAFLGLPKVPMFGMLHHGSYVSLLRTEDDRISFLRKVATDVCAELQLESHQIFIRYRHVCTGSKKVTYEYATALPMNRHSVKRKFDQSGHEQSCHRRWLYAGREDLCKRRLTVPEYSEKWLSVFGLDISGFDRQDDWGSDSTVPSDFRNWDGTHRSRRHPYYSDREQFDAAEYREIQQDYDRREKEYIAVGEEVITTDSQIIEDFAVDKMGVFWDRMGEPCQNTNQTPWFHYLYGDINGAAIFVLEGKGVLISLIRTVKQDSLDMYSLFEAERMEPYTVVRQLAEHFQTAEVETDPYMQSAKAVSTAAMIYRNFPDATIDIRVLQCRLWQSQWVRSTASHISRSQYQMTTAHATPPSLKPYSLDQACAFACVTMFESGHYDINPVELENVMALSSGDSLYVGAVLLCDPSVNSSAGTIKRIAGNIGRPGIAFLVPPVEPLIKSVSINEWPQLGQVEFDGELKDCFKSTSLHLSFTGASTPVNVKFSGVQDTDVHILETLVSVHDGGKWIADLNILKTFRSFELLCIPLCANRQHRSEKMSPSDQMTSIETWLAMIDELDRCICFVQTRGNWEARLAATSISVAKGYLTVVLPKEVCWKCYDDNINWWSKGRRPLLLIV